jgi:glycosyltransferase involved in cell wall biosynthesis/CDP-glycerol glycerophosphotransferase (TagB/SpsB family)
VTAQPYDVSVVVPVYNVEPYLLECLESLAAQTMFDRCQVVVVDDGSTDGSPDIVAAFAATHPNVLVHRQPNAGLGAARNAGLDRACGRYVMFCDSDDRLPSRAIEALWSGITRHNSTLAVGNMQTFPSPSQFPWQKYLGKGEKCYSGLPDAPDLIFSPSACNKMFDLAALRACGLRFRPGVHFEDAFLVIPFMLSASQIVLVDELVYEYRKRPTGDSIMDRLFTRQQNYRDHLLLVHEIARLRDGRNVFERDALNRWLVRSFQGFAMRAHTLFDEAELRSMFDICRTIYADLEPSFLVRWTADTRHRVPYLAFKTNDFELFARPGERVRGVLAYDGDLYLDYPVTPDLLPLTKVTRFTAQIEQVRVTSEAALEISGHFTINGLPLVAPVETPLALRLKGSAVTVPVLVRRRADIKASREDLEWSGFTAVVPLDRLRAGEHDIRLATLTPTGQASRRCHVTKAFLRDARTVSGGGHRVLPNFVDGGLATLIVRAARGTGDRLRWHRMLARRDLIHAVRRQPLWLPRLVRLLTTLVMRRRNVWLIGERTDTAQDNSWHLFKHLRRAERRRNVYYVISRTSPERVRLSGLGHVVAHGSWRHKFLLLHAHVLINAYDIDSYLVPPDWAEKDFLKHLGWRIGARRVFLQHGVTDKDVSKALHRAKSAVDLFVAAAEREARFVAEQFDMEGVVHALGFPRFDGLVPDRGNRRILFMPTWRAYLTSPSYDPSRAAAQRFDGSTYETFMRDFFANDKLATALADHDYTLEFLPHYEMRALTAGLVKPAGRIRVVDQASRGVQDALRQCDLFVTDWSSTAFDVAYMGTPVIYAQFDAEEYWAGHYRKGYFDTTADGFGPVCETVEETVDAIIGYLQGGCAREGEYTRRAERFFAHRDRNNSARVSAAIASVARGSWRQP